MPQVQLRFTREAKSVLDDLAAAAQYKTKLAKVRRTLGRIQVDPRHSGLKSHKYESIEGSNGEQIWESYVENRTPSAWRIFWHYGPGQDVITVVIIGPHP